MTAEAILHNQVIQKAWEDPSFKERLLMDPKAAIKEVLGVILPDHIKVKAVEESSDEFYLVLPQSPGTVMKKPAVSKYSW